MQLVVVWSEFNGIYLAGSGLGYMLDIVYTETAHLNMFCIQFNLIVNLYLHTEVL